MLNPEKEISFPESVKSFFKGELGIPLGGFPKNLQKKILGNEKQITVRPGSIIPPVDIDKVRSKLEKITESKISNKQLASYLMYPNLLIYISYRKK